MTRKTNTKKLMMRLMRILLEVDLTAGYLSVNTAMVAFDFRIYEKPRSRIAFNEVCTFIA